MGATHEVVQFDLWLQLLLDLGSDRACLQPVQVPPPHLVLLYPIA